MGENLSWETNNVTAEQRREMNGQYGMTVWFTGLSGSGKSTIAKLVEAELVRESHSAYLLDGDNLRHGLCADLGFSDADRDENIRRIASVAALFADAGVIALVSAISPFERMREYARSLSPRFLTVYVKADISVCSARDPKGNYAKAAAGLIKNYTGIDSPYEPPLNPDLILDTEKMSPRQCADMLLAAIAKEQKWTE